jgi:UDP-glucose 4-epimerase
MKVLVTGASGFVGTVTAVEALRRGWQVLGCGRSEQAPTHLTCSWQRWSDDAEAMAHVVECFAPDVVFHAAGSASVAASFEAPEMDWAASGGTLTTLLEAVRRSGAKPLIMFPSSAAVYGNPDQLPVPESDTLHPISPYGRHKVRCEELAREYRDAHGLRIVVFRLFSLFGPQQRRLLARELFEQAHGPSSCITIGGTGHETRDYISGSDFGCAVADFAKLHRESPMTKLEPWIFNVASGTETPILRLAEMMKSAVGCAKQIVCRNQVRPGDPTRWVADVSAFKHACPSWSPQSMEEALRDTVAAWVKEEQS